MGRRIPRVTFLRRFSTNIFCCVLLILVPGITVLGQNAHYLDLNREGTASVILTEDTKTALIVDGGKHSSDASALKLDGQPLLQYLYSHGYHNIVILCSHPHSDHIGGLLDIIRQRKSKPDDIDLRDFTKVVLIDSGHPHGTSLKAAFDETHGSVAAHQVHYVSADKQNAFDDPILKQFFGPGMNVEVSNFAYEAKPGSGTHGRSIVTQVRLSRSGTNKSTLLIDFDDADDHIIRAWAATAPDMLPKATNIYVVAPHHNSDYTNIAPLLALHTQGKVKFDGLVITASGRRPITFGHPGVQNYLRWGTALGSVNGIHVTGGVGTVTVTEKGISPLDVAGRKNTLERVILPSASRLEAKVQQFTEQSLAPPQRFPPAQLGSELGRCGSSMASLATRLGLSRDKLTSWAESDGADTELSGRIFQEVHSIKFEKKKKTLQADAYAIAKLSLAMMSDGTLPPPPGSTEGPLTNSRPPSPDRPRGSPNGGMTLVQRLGPEAFQGSSDNAESDGPEDPNDPPIGGGLPNGGPGGPQTPPSAPDAGARRFKVLSEKFKKSFGTTRQDPQSGVSQRQERFNFSSSGKPIFGGVIVGNQVTGPTVDLLKVEVRLVSGDYFASGDELSADKLVEIAILVKFPNGQRWYCADPITQTELWTAYHFVRPLAEWKKRYDVSDHECNLVGMHDVRKDKWIFGIHPAIEHTSLARDCMIMDMLIALLLNSAYPMAEDLRKLLEPINGEFTTYQWHDVASHITLAGDAVGVIPADPARTSLLGVRMWGCEGAQRTVQDLAARTTALAARRNEFFIRHFAKGVLLAVNGISLREAFSFNSYVDSVRSDFDKLSSDDKKLDEENKAFQARCGALKFDDVRFCEECSLRLPTARRFERFVRTVAFLRWIDEKNAKALSIPEGIVCLQGDIPATMSYDRVFETVQQTAFKGPLCVGVTAIDSRAPANQWLLFYASGLVAIAAVGGVIWVYRRQRIRAPDNPDGRRILASHDDAILAEDSKIIVACPDCSQRLRIPDQLGILVVTCPKCKHKWDYIPC